MAVTFNKPAGMKYTDMCIYIDKNMQWCVKTGEYPDIENKIYEYLYHIFYALACKDNYFSRFDDYDQYALYSAARLYILLRDKYIKAGTVVRGREIVPVKNTLDFIRSVMPHFRTDFQNQNFAIVFNPEINQDTSIIEADMKNAIRSDYQNSLEEDFQEVASQIPQFIKQIVRHTPYKKDKVMVRNLYMSCLLTLLNDITIPNRLKNKLNKSKVNDGEAVARMYHYNIEEPVLWHLDVGMSDYIRLLVTEVKYKFTEEFKEARSATDLSDDVVNSIMRSAYATYEERDTD